MRNSWILLLSLPLLYWLGNRPDPKLIVVGQLGENAERALRYEEVEFHREAGLTKISAKDPAALLRGLSRADQGLAAARDVVLENIRNKDTTKSWDGEPYRRKFPQFRPDGTLRDTTDDQGDYFWVYDPTHPDSVRDGPKAGYYAKPAIDPIQEQATLDEIATQRSVIQALIRQVDASVILSPVAPYELPKPSNDSPPDPSFAKLLKMSMLPPLDQGREFLADWGVKQSAPISKGQASVACALNWLSGESKYTEQTINDEYGFALLNALKAESLSLDLDWRDAGDLGEEVWPEIEESLRLQYPVILAFADPHTLENKIVVLVDSSSDTVRYFDPSKAQLVSITRQKLFSAPSHPDGNFVFLPGRLSKF